MHTIEFYDDTGATGGGGASSGAAGDGSGRGLDDRVADAPQSRFGEGGLSSHPLTIVAYP